MSPEMQNTIIQFLAPYSSKIAVFGSYARGEETKESDIDLMVELKVNMGLFEFAELREDLAEKLKMKVDLLTFNTVKNPLRKKYIEKDLTVIFNE
jgi:predicted nucleotidyltransferase